jgi:hypothetical protein
LPWRAAWSGGIVYGATEEIEAMGREIESRVICIIENKFTYPKYLGLQTGDD